MTSVWLRKSFNLPSCHGCTQVWIDPAGYSFRVNLRLLYFLKGSQMVEKMIKFLVHDCFFERFHCVIEYFVSRSFKFRIHREMWTGLQLFSQSVILNISHYMFHIHISCSWSDLHSVLSVSKLTWGVYSWKLLKAKFTLEGDITFWGTALLSNMVIQIILGFCGELGTLGTIHCSKWTSLLVTRKIKLCSLGTTILTCNFLVSTERRHFNSRSLTK